MKKFNLFFILVCAITVLFSSCDREMNYLKVDKYYIENATLDNIYLSISLDSTYSSFFRLEPYSRMELNDMHSSFVDYLKREPESCKFKLKIDGVDYILDNKSQNSPIFLNNYHRDRYLDDTYLINKYNVADVDAYVFSITDEYVESLKK